MRWRRWRRSGGRGSKRRAPPRAAPRAEQSTGLQSARRSRPPARPRALLGFWRFLALLSHLRHAVLAQAPRPRPGRNPVALQPGRPGQARRLPHAAGLGLFGAAHYCAYYCSPLLCQLLCLLLCLLHAQYVPITAAHYCSPLLCPLLQPVTVPRGFEPHLIYSAGGRAGCGPLGRLPDAVRSGAKAAGCFRQAAAGSRRAALGYGRRRAGSAGHRRA